MRRLLLVAVTACTITAGAALAAARHTRTAPPTTGRTVTIRVESPALGRGVRTLVHLPPGYDSSTTRYPTIYLLHGTPGDPDDLVDIGVTRTLDSLISAGRMSPVILVMPTGGPSRDSDTEWADSAVDPSQRWGTFVDRDLVNAVDADYRTLSDRHHRAIAGISMGGYGAANLGLRHRRTFGVVSSWSGYFLANTPSVEGPHGSAAWKADSPMLYVPKLKPSLKSLPVRLSFYSGQSDGFYHENVAFHHLLTRLGVPHRFVSARGGHDSRLWKARMPAELRWIGAQLAA
jgi:enterochelin esterase-like enzyme